MRFSIDLEKMQADRKMRRKEGSRKVKKPQEQNHKSLSFKKSPIYKYRPKKEYFLTN